MAKLTQTTRESSVDSTLSSESSCIVVGGRSRDISTTGHCSTDPTSNISSLSATPTPLDSDLIVQPKRSTRRITDTSIIKVSGEDMDRAMSGETLVERVEYLKATSLVDKKMEHMDDDTFDDSNSLVETKKDSRIKKATRISLVARATANMVNSTASTLGKRGREVLESGIETFDALTGSKRTSLRPRMELKQSNIQGKQQESLDGPRRKKSRVSKPRPSCLKSRDEDVQQIPANTLRRYKGKLWLTSGLYVGQDPDFDARLNEARRKVKRKSETVEPVEPKRKMLPMPMFAGQRLLENGRSFRLPFDVCSPLPPGQSRPEEWRKTQKNVFVGDAAVEWKHHKLLPPSRCLCVPDTGCDEDCQNRYMLYECDDSNCNIGRDCTNRAFADLKERVKKGNKFDIGVEVMKTAEKGFGVRANRVFEPHQIIMEYAGEIITQEECERRMRKEYKDNECYYLMVFDQNMIIDATRGSMARFVNHSCEPNCRMVKWTVAGKPRMALFAGDYGIMTGEELTYDYNFDPFSQKNVQICRCGAESCRGFLGPRLSERAVPKAVENIVAGVKRKITEALGVDSSKSQDREKADLKKPRVTILGSTEVEPAKAETKPPKVKPGWYWEPIKNTKQEQIMSSSDGGSTLINKENIIPNARLRRTSSQSSMSVKSGKSAKQTASNLSRRRTVDVLSRVASSIKRNASLVRRSRKVETPRSQLKLLRTKTITEVGLVRRLEVELQTQSETFHVASRNSSWGVQSNSIFESRTANNRPMTAASVKSAAASVRRGIGQSVKGPKRAAAVAKVGLMGGHGEISRQTMRLISGEH